MGVRQGRSSLLTLISSDLVLASHPIVAEVTRLCGLPDVAFQTSEPGPAPGFFLLESFSQHCLLGGVKRWLSVVSRDSLGCNRCYMDKVEFNRLNFYHLTKRRNRNNIFRCMIAPKLFMTMSLP